MRFFGIVCAVVLHAAFLLFGGLLLPKAEATQVVHENVELLSDDKPEEKKPDEPKDVPKEQVEQETPPDSAELLKNLDNPQPADAPALDASSLAAIEQALSGGGAGGGDFAEAVGFGSGGRIGGLGKGGVADEQVAAAFSLADIDQKPRPVFQPPPAYPATLRSKKVEGIVTVIFVVDQNGRVADPRIEKSNNPAFDKPVLDAVRQWKFEPAIKGGQRVPCRMRAPLRLQPGGQS